MDTTTDDIMTRFRLLMEDWMRRVEASRGSYDEFYSHGVILGARGTLRINAVHTLHGVPLWELSMGPRDTQVRITYPSGESYLV